MAFCPNCNATMGQADVRCPECGYDFPDTSGKGSKRRFPYSPLADFALVIGGMCSVLGCIGAILAGNRHVIPPHCTPPKRSPKSDSRGATKLGIMGRLATPEAQA